MKNNNCLQALFVAISCHFQDCKATQVLSLLQETLQQVHGSVGSIVGWALFIIRMRCFGCTYYV